MPSLPQAVSVNVVWHAPPLEVQPEQPGFAQMPLMQVWVPLQLPQVVPP